MFWGEFTKVDTAKSKGNKGKKQKKNQNSMQTPKVAQPSSSLLIRNKSMVLLDQ